MKYIVVLSILYAISWADSDKQLYEILKNQQEDNKTTKNEKINKVKIDKISDDDNNTKVYKNIQNIIKKDKKIKNKIKKDEKVLVKD